MPVRYFASRPTATAMVQWDGTNLEEIRDFWEPRGYNRYDFDIAADDNLINPSGNPLPLGTFTIAMGGFSYASEDAILGTMQEVDNPEGMKYSIVEQPLP